MHIFEDFFINPDSQHLNSVASRARDYAKGEKHKEAATKRRKVKASGDHFEKQMGWAVVWAFIKLVGIGAAIAFGVFVLVTMFFLIF